MEKKLGGFSFKNRKVGIKADLSYLIENLGSLMGLDPTDLHSVENLFTCVKDKDNYLVFNNVSRAIRCDELGAIASLAQSVPYFLLPFGLLHALHGGAFVADGKSQIFLGEGWAGKSTLALTAWLKGCEVIGDDYLILDTKSRTIQPTPKPIKLRITDGHLPKHLETKLHPKEYCIGRVEEQWTAIISRRLNGFVPLNIKYPIGNIFIIERSFTNSIEVTDMEKGKFIEIMFNQLVAAPRNDLEVLRCLSVIFMQGGVYGLKIGNGKTDEAVERIIEMAFM